MSRIINRGAGRRRSMARVWEKLGQEWSGLNRIIGERLKKWAERLTARQKSFFLVGSMGAVAVGSVYCFVLGASGSGRHIEVKRISIPADIGAGPPLAGDEIHNLGGDQLEQLKRLARYGDSLQQSRSAGYDSVLKSDPNFEMELTELKSILKQYNLK